MNRFILALTFVFTLAAQPVTLRVRITNHVEALPLERYVAGVLAGESSVFRSNEPLRAMAVVARTYGIKMRGRHKDEGFDLCDTTHCQRVDLHAITRRLEAATADTAQQMLWYQGKLAFTPYSKDCGGRSEDAGIAWPDLAAPYLRSRPDEACLRAQPSHWHWIAEPAAVERALKASGLRAPANVEKIGILDRTAGGRASLLLLSSSTESVRISAGSFRFAVGRELGWENMRSDLYDVHVAGGKWIFEGRGEGHGVGLCQLGAEQMGLAGRSFKEILSAYYPGTVLGVNAKGIPWQSLSNDSIMLWTTHPETDGSIIAQSERSLRSLRERSHFTEPKQIVLRLYPDVETFRDSTGEPGWVAAHTVGREIHLQPLTILRQRGGLEAALAHELAHALIEANAARDLPIWFREGLAGVLAGEKASGSAQVPREARLRQTADPKLAQQAYRDAVSATSLLVERYGEWAVLGWVKRGLPPEVINANPSQPSTKNK